MTNQNINNAKKIAAKNAQTNRISTPSKQKPVASAKLRSSNVTSANANKIASSGASDKKKVQKKVKNPAPSFIKRIAKIDRLPKSAQDTIPICGVMNNGIIETSPGEFTKSYKIQDINFAIATKEEQQSIFDSYMEFLNTFDPSVRWQFCIFNHEMDKRETLRDIHIPAQRDGLNPYRQELNKILVDNLQRGNNSIIQEKILTVSVKEKNQEKAVSNLKKVDIDISQGIRRITKKETRPMSLIERFKLLYNIYNQESDYRLATGIYENGNESFDMKYIEKQGLNFRDVIGPSSFEFPTSGTQFSIGNMYAKALYLQNVPKFLTSQFLAELSEIQNNMLISLTYEGISSGDGIKMVRNKLSNIDGQVSKIQSRNSEAGYFGALPPELEKSQAGARDLMNDIMSRNQNFFLMTFLVVVFSRTQEGLEEAVRQVEQVANKNLTPIKLMRYQQEFAFNTALPLCRNDVSVERLYTTETAAVFIPFNSQEINQKNAIFYGLNQTSKSMIMYDRTTGNNYNGLIFGYSGSGKSFIAKCEMVSALLSRQNSQIFVVDPQGEYAPLVKAMGGQEILLAPSSYAYINPLDIDISEDADEGVDPVTMKSDFIQSLIGIIIGKDHILDPVAQSLVDKVIRKIYRPYIDYLHTNGLNSDPDRCPTLNDLYQELNAMKYESAEAGYLADILFQYTAGSFDTFAHRTNVQTHARFVVYNTKRLGTGMKELGLYICLSDIWGRMIANSKKGIYTWFYVDEFHILLESDDTTLFLKRIWKMARKWLGVPTGIMQNTEDILRTADTRAIFNNTSFIIMLQEPLLDRRNLSELLHLSDAQLSYITDSEQGHGILNNGKFTLPFAYDFPKNTNLYRFMTTKHDVNEEGV